MASYYARIGALGDNDSDAVSKVASTDMFTGSDVSITKRSKLMRQFIRLRPRRAIDPEFDIQCGGTGQIEPYEAIGMYSEIYSLVWQKTKKRESFAALHQFGRMIKTVDGVKIFESIIGSRHAYSIDGIIKLKAFCEFVGTDFEFLQYIGSGIINSVGAAGGFRALALATEDDLLKSKSKVAIPDSAARWESGLIVLADSKETFGQN